MLFSAELFRILNFVQSKYLVFKSKLKGKETNKVFVKYINYIKLAFVSIENTDISSLINYNVFTCQICPTDPLC